MAEPPPTASTASAPGGTSIRSDGISDQRAACGRSSESQRALATSSGRSTPSSARTACSSPSDQRTINAPASSSVRRSLRALACEVEEGARVARLGAAARAYEVDVALEREPFDSRGGERAGGKIGLDGRAGDERHAVPGFDRGDHGLLQAELETDVEIAQPDADTAQLVLDHLPDAGAVLHHDQRLRADLVERDVAAGEGVAGRAGEDDLVVEERLEDDAAVPTPGADDAELELAGSDALDDRLRVEDVERDVELGVPLLELAEQVREHDPAGPGRGADVEGAVELVSDLERDLGQDLLLEREQPLRPDVEPHPGFGRLDPAA